MLCFFVTAQHPTSGLRADADRIRRFISAAVDPRHLSDSDYANALIANLNMVEPENAMKFAPIQPERDRYDFAAADAVVAFAEAHNMRVRGHTLVWHESIPAWLNASKLSPPELNDILHKHINTEVSRYKGRVLAWDVVNEAFAVSGPQLRSTLWYDSPGIGHASQGTRYIEQAFRWANDADPAALLFYNDFDTENINPKSDAVYSMLRDFRARNVPVHGVGFQMHLRLTSDLSSLARNLERFAALGLQIHITELDVAIPLSVPGSSASPEQLLQQANIYRQVAEACLRVPQCTAIQTWGITDRYSWIPGYSKGKDGAALPLDTDYRPKPAYAALRDALQRAR